MHPIPILASPNRTKLLILTLLKCGSFVPAGFHHPPCSTPNSRLLPLSRSNSPSSNHLTTQYSGVPPQSGLLSLSLAPGAGNATKLHWRVRQLLLPGRHSWRMRDRKVSNANKSCHYFFIHLLLQRDIESLPPLTVSASGRKE